MTEEVNLFTQFIGYYHTVPRMLPQSAKALIKQSFKSV